ncbi:MAG: metallophosphoesterase family protein [Chloroflexota bacterium]
MCSQRTVDFTVCAGDLVCYGANHNLVIHQIRQRNIPTVTGNYDTAVAWDLPYVSQTGSPQPMESLQQAALQWTRQYVLPKDRTYLQSLPWQLNYCLDGLRVTVLHAGLDRLDEELTPDQPESLRQMACQLQADVVILGHTHIPFVYECVHHFGTTLFINAGSVGRAFDGDPRAAYAIFDTKSKTADLKRIDYNVEAASKAIAVSGMPHEIADMVRLGLSYPQTLSFQSA